MTEDLDRTQDVEPVRRRRVRIGFWINQGWDWFVEEIGMHVLIALIPALAFFVTPFFILFGPFYAGLAQAGLRKAAEDRVEFKDFTDGFSNRFLAALLGGLLISVFVCFGLLFLIVPGLVILAMYQFTYHFIVDGDLDFWEAMESSRKMVAQDYLGFTMFAILLALINGLGMLLMGVGLLASVPITWLSLTAAYLDFTGGLPEPTSEEPVHID